jgi:hypothetical protein
MTRTTIFAGILILAACGPTPVDQTVQERGAIAPSFTAVSGPSLAPPADEVELRLIGSGENDTDTMVVGLPGDTVVIVDLDPGEYQLSIDGRLDPFIVWKSGPQRVIVLPGTLSEPTISPFAFEVTNFATTSTLPLTGGALLELTWTELLAHSARHRRCGVAGVSRSGAGGHLLRPRITGRLGRRTRLPRAAAGHGRSPELGLWRSRKRGRRTSLSDPRFSDLNRYASATTRFPPDAGSPSAILRIDLTRIVHPSVEVDMNRSPKLALLTTVMLAAGACGEE